MFSCRVRLSNDVSRLAMLLTDSHNSMSQKAKCLLEAKGYKVSVEIAGGIKAIEQSVQRLEPDLIVCPFLTKRIPKSVWQRGYPHPHRPCIIVQPGVKGSKGISSIEWSLHNSFPHGVTCVSAVEDMGAGPVWSTRVIKPDRLDVSTLSKSSVYKHEIVEAAVCAMGDAIDKVNRGEAPVEVTEHDPALLKPSQSAMTEKDRAVCFEQSACQIARKIAISDGQPGAPVRLHEKMYFAFDAWPDKTCSIKPGPSGVVIGERDGALAVTCGPTGEDVVWFGHLKTKNGIKLKAAEVCKVALRAPPGDGISTLGQQIHWSTAGSSDWFCRPADTYMELWTQTVDRVAYVVFEFYNGAMSTGQCLRLSKAIRELRENDGVDAIVLAGGYNAFSYGMNLHTIEVAQDPAEESWNNVNAINDVVREIFHAKNKLVIAALRGNAGAGGCMIALAADQVWAHENVLINPHYKTMALSGSEYWTYSLPRRVGENQAKILTETKQAYSAVQALNLKILDEVFESNVEAFQQTLHARVMEAVQTRGEILLSKSARDMEEIEACRRRELLAMKDNFASRAYDSARRKFVTKTAVPATPIHLTHRRGQSMSGTRTANSILERLHAQVTEATKTGTRAPGLGIVVVDGRSDSDLYVARKVSAARRIGVDVQLCRLSPEGDDGKTFRDAARQIREWNTNENIDGIMVQLPITDVDTKSLCGFISPLKDVDCLNPTSAGAYTLHDRDSFVPPCPLGILHLLLDYGVPLTGKYAAVFGTSPNLGLPVACLLEQEGCQVTMLNVHGSECVSRGVLKNADIVVSTTGVPHLLKPDALKSGVVIVDAGISFVNGKLCGDADPRCKSVASLMSPVPGGVGPMTIASLLENLVENYLKSASMQTKFRKYLHAKGVFTYEDAMERLAGIFRTIDADGSNSLETEEIGDELKKTFKDVTNEEVKTLLRHLDVDGDGVVDPGELLSLALNAIQSTR